MESQPAEVTKNTVEASEAAETSEKLEKPVKTEETPSGDLNLDVKEEQGEYVEVPTKKEDSDVKMEVDQEADEASNQKSEVKDEEEEENEISDEDQGSDEDEEEQEESQEPPKQEEKVLTRLNPKFLYEDPQFAHVCSFFNTFGSALGIGPTISKLEELFTTEENGEPLLELTELQTFLFKRLSYMKYAQIKRFPGCMKKFVETNIETKEYAAELQMHGYNDLSYPTKINILTALCHAQFDYNFKFKEVIHHTFHVFDMRWGPIGVDRNGVQFFYQEDKDFNIRIFAVDPNDVTYESWELKARTLKELYKLISHLKSPDYGNKVKEESDEDEEKILEIQQQNGEDSQHSQPDEEPLLELRESERNKVEFITKTFTRLNKYWPEEMLNHKRNLKNIRKAAKLNPTPTKKPKRQEVEEVEEEEQPVEEEEEKEKSEEVEEESEKEKSQEKEAEEKKDESKEEEVLINMDELADERRILPRRSARNAAYSNMKQFTTPTRKRAEKKEEPEKKESEPEEEEEEDEFEDDEDDEEVRSSDDEFVMSKKKGRRRRKGLTPKRTRKPRLDEDGEPIKRRKPKPKPAVLEDSSEEEDVEEEEKQRKKANEKTLCMKCNKATRPNVLLLCDECDDAWHTFCLTPKLKEVPPGDWFCPKCNHNSLILRLSVCYVDLAEKIKAKRIEDERRRIQEDNERRRMERALRREHVNGIDLRNIVDAEFPVAQPEPESESEEDLDDGQRKSKKKALKQFGHTKKEKIPSYPSVTIAAGRSRRHLNNVDYNFRAYDDQIIEAMDAIDEPGSSNSRGEERPNGLGRGKDMQNIIEADEKRQNEGSEVGQENGEEPAHNGKEKSPKKERKPKKAKKLTQLDLDNMTESDTDEYNVTEEEEEEEEIPSEDEYVPDEVVRARRGTRNRHESDDEFIDDSDSEFEIGNKKKKGGKQKKIVGKRGKKRGKGRKKWSDTEEETEEEEEEFISESDSETERKSKRKPAPRKWGPKASSSESEEVEAEESEESEDEKERTESGRPLRRAAKGVSKKLHDLEENEKELEEEIGEEEEEAKDERSAAEKVIGRPRPRKIQSDEEEDPDEFKPDEEEQEEEEEEIEEELAKELEEKKRKKLEHEKEKDTSKKRKILEEDDEQPPKKKPETKVEPRKEERIEPRRKSPAKNPPKKQRNSPPKSPPKTISRRGSNSTPATNTPTTAQSKHPPPSVKPLVQLAVPLAPPVQHIQHPHQLPPQGYNIHPYAHLPPHMRPPTYMPPPPHGNQYGDYYGGPPQYMPPTSGYPPPHHHAYPHYPPMPGYPMQPTSESDVAHLQPLRPVESDSLSHVLGGAMNPDAL